MESARNYSDSTPCIIWGWPRRRLHVGEDRANFSTGEHDGQPCGGRGADEEQIERERLRQDDTIQKGERAEGNVLGRGAEMLLLGERREV
jgi:hypothetical protein